MEISCESKYVLWHNRSIRPRWLWTSVVFLSVSRTDTSETLRCEVHAPLFLQPAKTAAIDDGSIHVHWLCLLLVNDSHSPPWLNNFRAKVERISPAPCPRQLNFTAPIHVQKLISLALASQHTLGYNPFLEPSLSARAACLFTVAYCCPRYYRHCTRQLQAPPFVAKPRPLALEVTPRGAFVQGAKTPSEWKSVTFAPHAALDLTTARDRLCPRLCLVETARRQASLKEKQKKKKKKAYTLMV